MKLLADVRDVERDYAGLGLEPGKTLDDLDRFFEQGEGKGTPPAIFHGAMQTILAGTSVFIEIDLQEGVEYTIADSSGDQPIVATFTPG